MALKEMLIRIEFLVDMGDKESPFIASTLYTKGSCGEVAIPKIQGPIVEQIGDRVDRVRITVFQELDSD